MFNTHNQIRLKVYDQSGSSVTRFGAILTLCQFLKVLGKFARIYLVLGIAKYWIYFGFFSCYWANFHCCKCSKIELVNNRAIWLGCLQPKKTCRKKVAAQFEVEWLRFALFRRRNWPNGETRRHLSSWKGLELDLQTFGIRLWRYLRGQLEVWN